MNLETLRGSYGDAAFRRLGVDHPGGNAMKQATVAKIAERDGETTAG